MGRSIPAPMSDLQYRTCQHSGEKVFAEQSRLLTYRGNTYRTRVFQARQLVNGNNSNVVELFEGQRAACASAATELFRPCLLRGFLLRSIAPSRRPGPWRRAIGLAERLSRQKMAFALVWARAMAVETGSSRRVRG